MSAPVRQPGRGDRKKSGSSGIHALLREDEKILRVARIHPGIYWKSVLSGLVTLFLLMMPGLFPLGVFLGLVTLAAFSFATLYKHYLLLVLTDQRVFLRHGILRVDMIQIRHSKIESVETERTIMGQILGYAAIVIYGTGSRRTAIPFIADGTAFRNELDERLSVFDKVEK